jgi:hypothetical protein
VVTPPRGTSRATVRNLMLSCWLLASWRGAGPLLVGLKCLPFLPLLRLAQRSVWRSDRSLSRNFLHVLKHATISFRNILRVYKICRRRSSATNLSAACADRSTSLNQNNQSNATLFALTWQKYSAPICIENGPSVVLSQIVSTSLLQYFIYILVV